MKGMDFTELPAFGRQLDPARLLDAATRQQLPTFIHRCFQTVSPGVRFLDNWHIEAIAHHLGLVQRGEIRRLIITMPPRSLKSICASVAFPGWLLGHDPTKRIICASYAQELSAKLGNDFRAVVNSDWYQRVFPRTRIDPSKNNETEVVTTARGSRFSTSVGGTLTGRGGNIIIIDDPLKPSDAMSESRREGVKQWFDNTLYSRLDDKNRDAIVLVMQRVHIDDLAGYLLEKGGWQHLSLPAMAEEDQRIAIADNSFHVRRVGDLLHPDREGKAALDDLKRTMGSYAFSAQYQQQPVPLGGGMIRSEWFVSFRDRPVREADDQIVMSWDTANKASELADYSVGQTWHVNRRGYHLIGQLREKLDYPDLKRLIIREAEEEDVRTILIEDKGSGTSLIQELKRHSFSRIRPSIIGIVPKDDKVMRMHAQTAKLEGGQVYLPESAPWLGDFRNEVSAFPHGSHDDQVDAMSQFLGWLDERTRRTVSHGSFFAERRRR